ncbi:hypothetical protein HOH45_08005 [bacterium]|jgi:hypothetical protein|nr:hypothetical protein [bacterium]
MIKKIIFVEPTSLGKCLAILVSFLTFLILGPLMVQAVINGKFDFRAGMIYLIFLLIQPFLGFFLGTLIGYVYNYSAKKFGGIEIIFEEMSTE